MEKLLELDNIVLYPAEINQGRQEEKNNYGVKCEFDGVNSLPIFTSPMDSVINKDNIEDFNKVGIRPILPRTESIEDRILSCQYIFSAFSLGEVIENFLAHGKRESDKQFKICMDCGNGHDAEIFHISSELRKVYGNQVIIMAGNIGNPRTYIDYCKAGIDYVRVGLTNGSLVDRDKFGFYYPTASMLIDINGIKNTSCIGLKQTKIIVDGGICCASDIIKCMALGADYVMCGREFVRLIEAAGTIYKVEGSHREALLKNTVREMSRADLKEVRLQRLYCGNTTYDIQAARDGYNNVREWLNNKKKTKLVDSKIEWVNVSSRLSDWLREVYDCFSYGFMMANATNWKEFRQNIHYSSINPL